MKTWTGAVSAATLVLGTQVLGAQSVRGEVLEVGGRPLPSVVVLLLDSANRVAARTLSADNGGFWLAAPAPGQYRLRTMRIGYRPFTSESIILEAGTSVSRRLEVAAIAVTFDTLRVVAKSVCRLRADSAAATFAVWDQVRTGLHSVQATAAARSLDASVLVRRRRLNPEGDSVRFADLTLQSENTSMLWSGLSADSLSKVGYIEARQDGSATYHVPNLDVLVSDRFLDDHCFRITESQDPAIVGITFTPTSARRRVPEIQGVVWLDRKSSELRQMSFGYVNVPRYLQGPADGGVSFTRLRDGTWLISDWRLKMPVFERRISQVSFNKRTTQSDERILSEIQEIGASLVLAVSSGDTVWAAAPQTMRGILLDSRTSRPIARATVALAGVPSGIITDSLGQFAVDARPGRYSASVTRDSLLLASRIPVTFTSSENVVSIQAFIPAPHRATTVSASQPLDPSRASAKPVEWSGSFYPQEQRHAGLTVTGKNRVFGSVQLTPDSMTSERATVALVITTLMRGDASLPWGIFPGRCGSGSGLASPVVAPHTVPLLDVSQNGKAQIKTQVHWEGRANETYHVNVFRERSSADLASVFACADIKAKTSGR